MQSSPDKNFWARLPHPFTILAPMEDVTDTVFRHLIATRGAPDVFMSEFINAGELFHKKRPFARRRALIDDVERRALGLGADRPEGGPFLVAQIWGNDPESYRKAIPALLESGFDGIDINMGCPAEKVVRRGECSGLIERPNQAAELILAAQESAAGYPVSVKTRLGLKYRKTLEWAGFLLGFGLPLLTIHGRITAQMSEGEADWDEIRKVRVLRDERGLATKIAGNGDLFSADDLDRRYEQTKVDGLMVGRGIFRDPDIFRRERPHRSFDQAPWNERKAVMLQHTTEHQRIWGGIKGFDMLKQFYKCYTRGPEAYLTLREQLFQCRTYEAALDAIGRWTPPDDLSGGESQS